MSLACVVNCIKFKNGQRHKDVNSIKKNDGSEAKKKQREQERERERVEGQKTARKRNKETKLLNIIIKKILN